ncbi:MAG TPA: hypothetical protein PLE51_01720 [Candidatus Pacearchaeota archaeon]|nr:hypothetical protein [Candidatus Pacearchaeota archaeon]HOR52362.1 hypothetical protein [Candidatus Pacearchaeota archaeon]HOU79175.1 hypothetical protein [Candidatus Pacearchaeota archaeon]HPJ87005.1 hypothetical protein [Candidatus Pacearchaeota archaeon]HQF82966.1 hypothetical protein [Candidatus Pacearchaeota archaeon]
MKKNKTRSKKTKETAKKQKVKNQENKKLNTKTEQQLIWISYTAILMVIGLIFFKYLPMYLSEGNILYDASYHVLFTILLLYILWFFIDQKKSWRIPYFIFSGVLIIIVSLQRIIAQEHNEVGIILALLIGAVSIIIPRWKEFMGGVKF